jgi:hypothetical protein
MMIWLDDEFEARQSWFPAADGWVHCRWPADVIAHLQTGLVTDLSLDHDLGEGSEYEHPRTGADVVKWLEEQVMTGAWPHATLPRIRIHSRNPVGRDQMKAGLRAIYRKFDPERYRD